MNLYLNMVCDGQTGLTSYQLGLALWHSLLAVTIPTSQAPNIAAIHHVAQSVTDTNVFLQTYFIRLFFWWQTNCKSCLLIRGLCLLCRLF